MRLAMEVIDLAKDPYFMKNHLGQYECRLCLTLHLTEGNYLAHTQGKRHQDNLGRRAAREAKMAEGGPLGAAGVQPAIQKKVMPRRTIKIGRPGYKVTKQIDPTSGQKSLTFEIKYPDIGEGIQPRHRFMSSFEQKVETPDRNFQYLLFAAEPYETIAFKIPNWEIERGGGGEESKFYTNWDRDSLTFTVRSNHTPPTCFPLATAGSVVCCGRPRTTCSLACAQSMWWWWWWHQQVQFSFHNNVSTA